MASVNVRVETENMRDIRTQMLLKIDDIITMLDKTSTKINESQIYFDTPTAKVFREKVDLYIGQQKQTLENDIKPFIEDALLEIINIYDEEIDVEKKIVEDGKVEVNPSGSNDVNDSVVGEKRTAEENRAFKEEYDKNQAIRDAYLNRDKRPVRRSDLDEQVFR